MGTHFSFLFSIYSENHGVQAVQLNFSRSSHITYVVFHWFYLVEEVEGESDKVVDKDDGLDEADAEGAGDADAASGVLSFTTARHFPASLLEQKLI